MPILGSDGGFQADNRGGIIDELGNTIVSSDTSFAASPLGVAARTQALYGIPNANFNLTPPDPASPIVANQNDLPYWAIENLSDDQITATTIFDATAQTWGVTIDPGTAATGSSLTMTTRSYLLTDDNLALRQKAQAVLAKSGTAGGTASQWNLSLSAIYYDSTDTALSTAIIGTVFDTGTWTSLAGTTTPGGSAINSAAQYVDLTFTMTTTAAVTGSAKATIKSLLLTTSVAGGGGSQSFLVTETFTSSTTWTRPTGVDYLVAAIGLGAGGGGGGGGVEVAPTTSANAEGGGGGGSGNYIILRDLYIGGTANATISVGIGAGGVGGTATTVSKPAGGSASYDLSGGDGGNGGATTFGSFFTMDYGRGGKGYVAGQSSAAAGGNRAGNPTTIVYGATTVNGGGGGIGARDNAAAGAGTAGGFTNFDLIPYNAPGPAAGAAGGSGAGAGGANGSVYVTTAIAGGTAGYISGGGGGGGVTGTTTPTFRAAGASQKGGGGSGGQAVWGKLNGTTTMTGTAGNGGSGGANVGGGGGGGGGFAVATLTSLGTQYPTSTITVTSGAGGAGSDGSVTVVYIA